MIEINIPLRKGNQEIGEETMKEFHKTKKTNIDKENKHQHAKLSFIERNSFISKTNKVSAFIYIYIY